MKQIKMLSLMLSVLMFATFLVATVHLGKATTIVSTYLDNTVLKLDSNGNILWATNVGGTAFKAVENPIDNTIYAVLFFCRNLYQVMSLMSTQVMEVFMLCNGKYIRTY